jgi:hypothetical protein
VKTGFCGLQSGSGLGFGLIFWIFADFRVGGAEITGYLSTFAAVEEFALQNFPQTRAILRSICPFGSTTRLAPNFHHKHVQPPLARFVIFISKADMIYHRNLFVMRLCN